MAPSDIDVFPLAFPLIAGPSALAAIVLLMDRADLFRAVFVLTALIVCLAVTYLTLLAEERLKALLGVTGADAVGRVSGILLVARAAQSIFDGLSEAHRFAA